MLHSQLLVWLLAVGPAIALPATGSLKADIRADSNRDGIVDIDGATDLADKHEWSNTAGAIFLANIGDTDRRCSKEAVEGPPLSNEELAACNDASDDVQRAPQFMAPIRTMPIPDVDDSTIGHVSIQDETVRKLVRIFRREGDEWIFTPNEYEFTAEKLRRGLELGIDARNTRQPEIWDGRVSIDFNVSNSKEEATDFVYLRVSPVLTHHHAQRTLEFFVARKDNEPNFYQDEFVSNITAILDERMPDLPLTLLAVQDFWVQDFFESGYMSMPGPNGMVALQVLIRSAQDTREAGRYVFEYLRKTGRGAVYYPGGRRNDVNAMGNFETIPPYTFNGKHYPAGRIYQAKSHGSQTPHIFPYFQAQEVQDPILLDLDWTAIGHVDEFFSFVPFNNSRGWVALFADPDAGYDVLTKAQRSGHGNTKMFSRQDDPRGDPWDIPGGIDTVPTYTIDEFLSQNHTRIANAKFSNHIAANIRTLKRETGITDEEIISVPSMFGTGLTFPPGFGYSPEINGSSEHAFSLYPSAVNGVLLSKTEFLAPRPWGPVISGRDIMADAILSVYEKLGYHVSFIDDWSSNHKYGGDVHCGSNTRRDPSAPWW